MSDFDAASYGGDDDDLYEDDFEATEGNEVAGESGEERELAVDEERRGRTSWGFTLTDDTSASEALRNWVSYLPAAKIDLVSDIGDSRGIYVVHMESLLINVLQSEMPNFETQPIFAKALFSVERCLSILAELRGTAGMRLVFFDCVEVLYRTKSSVFWTLREALRLHLLATKGSLVRVFKDWVNDPDWAAFVEEQGVAFMVCADNDVQFNPPEDDDGNSVMPKDMVQVASGLLQCLMLDVVTNHQIRVAIISTMERRVHRLMSVTVGPERGHSGVLARVSPVVEGLLGTLNDEDDDEEEEEEDPQAFVEQIEGAVKDYVEQFKPDGGVRGFITRIGLEQTLQECLSLVEDSGEEAGPVELCLIFGKVMAACEVLLQQMPLHARSHCTFTDETFPLVATGDIASALDDFFVNCRLILTPLANYMKTNPDYMAGMGLKNDISDMFDSRLFRTVFYLVLANPSDDGVTYDLGRIFGFQGSSLATYQKYWASIVADIEFPENLAHAEDSLKATLSVEIGVPSKDELPAPPADAPAPVLIQTTVPLVDMIVKTAKDPKVGQALTKLERDETQVIGEELEDYPQAQPFDSIDALLKKHEKGKYTMDSKWLEKLPPHKREAARKKFELRMKQRGMYSTHMYSKSLVGADKLHHPIVMTEEEQNAMRAASDKSAQKLSAKAQQIKEKNERQALDKQNNRDKEQMEPLLVKAERLGDMGDRPPHEIEGFLLDLVAGFGRILDSFDGFNGISQSVKLRENQIVVLFAVIDNLRSALKTVGRTLEIDNSDTYVLETRHLVARSMKLVCDVVKSFGGDLTPTHIKKIQQLLQTIGAKRVNKNVFIYWKQQRIPVLEKEISELEQEAAASAKADKKSKKKGKESPEGKDKKSKSKKGKKVPETAEEKLEAAKEELEDIDECYSEVRSKKVAVDVIGKDEYLFMLYHMGQDLDRPVGKKPDDRVLFKPDEWQRQLLDIVDKKESALVCAPTSSGKTFICYYAMEKVLRQSHDGVAVYVAPTKALLNQVSAEIYSRFSSKTYPSTVRVELAGTFAKEFSQYPMTCQVLVTIPEVFEQIMLAPSQAEWVKKLRYVIFDEVHCIGEAENSAAWEHLMQLTQCPFLALSATVGNPKGFCKWLNNVAASNHGQKVNLVEYKERYNDLKKWVYISGSGLFELHPIACLTYLDVNDGTLPSDLVMTPEEAAECYVALKAVMFDKNKDRSEKDKELINTLMDPLEPKTFFKFVRGCINKRQFRWYENELRAALSTLLKEGVCDVDDFNELVSILRNPSARGNPIEENKKWKKVSGEEEVLSTEASSDEEGEEEETASTASKPKVEHLAPHLSELGRDATYLRPARTVQLIRELQQLNLLPALIFNFDRHDIMTMVRRCTQYLAKQQYAKYHGSEERDHRTKMENKRRMEVYKKKLEQVKVMERMKANDEDFDQTVLDELVPKPIPVEEEYDPEFYFCGVKAMSDPDVEELIKKLERKTTIPKIYIDALRRGIGMHHEGLPSSFRKTVEILFRKGFLQVVVATGTLALGINMPCKATVFAGSSVELNALMYRQMAGRAGRRGFDLLGNVIFYDLPFSDIRQLQGSHVPYLRGDFSLTPTLVLRAIQLRQRLKAEGRLTVEADRSIMTMITKALYSSEMNLTNETVVLFRYTVDFLLREKLIRPNGDLIGLAPVVTALFEREPDNLVLHRLLTMPGLEDIIKRWKKEERKADETTHATYKLLQVLSWFILPWPQLRHSKDRVIEKRQRHQPTASCPVLYEKDLEPEFRDLVPKYNTAVKDELLRMAVLNFKMKGKVSNDEASFELPFTHTEYRRSFGEDIWADDSEVMSAFMNHRVKCTVRSPFSALGGSGDEFESAQELIRNCRPGFSMDLGKVPCSPFGDGLLSSYITDFFVHGRLEFLQKDNLLGASESWKIVHEWVETLEWLTTVLEAMKQFDAPTLKEVVKDLYTTLDRKLYEEGSK